MAELESASAAGSFDRPADPPAAPGFEVGQLPDQLVAPNSSPPVRLSVPAIGVETPLLRLGLEPDRSMEVPADFDRAGWFAGGPAPGQAGPAVIAGHVDSKTGPAVFYRLRELRAGDHLQVTRADGTRLRFAVDATRSFPKAGFPTEAVFGPTPAAELRLVTCSGTFDRARGSYRDNLVVFARLAGTG
jgi:sortase (surface protein transpeptidase)